MDLRRLYENTHLPRAGSKPWALRQNGVVVLKFQMIFLKVPHGTFIVVHKFVVDFFLVVTIGATQRPLIYIRNTHPDCRRWHFQPRIRIHRAAAGFICTKCRSIEFRHFAHDVCCFAHWVLLYSTRWFVDRQGRIPLGFANGSVFAWRFGFTL